MKFTARVWKFGDNINTDLILPNAAFYLTQQEQLQYIFRANRPGWADLVQPGDILIGGKNFGMGSSRPAARNLKNLGIACLVADSIIGLFYRNSVNFALPAMECASGGYLPRRRHGGSRLRPRHGDEHEVRSSAAGSHDPSATSEDRRRGRNLCAAGEGRRDHAEELIVSEPPARFCRQRVRYTARKWGARI